MCLPVLFFFSKNIDGRVHVKSRNCIRRTRMLKRARKRNLNPIEQTRKNQTGRGHTLRSPNHADKPAMSSLGPLQPSYTSSLRPFSSSFFLLYEAHIPKNDYHDFMPCWPGPPKNLSALHMAFSPVPRRQNQDITLRCLCVEENHAHIILCGFGCALLGCK